MATFINGESLSSVRTKINDAIDKIDGNATISNNIDVAGTVTADGLTVDGNIVLDGILQLKDSGGTARSVLDYSASDDVTIATGTSSGARSIYMITEGQNALRVHAGGNISFYENTGTTAKFFWDAAAESLGIGTDSPASTLDVRRGSTGTIAEFRGADTDILHIDGDSNAITLDARNVASLNFEMQGSEAMRIDSSGNVLVGGSTVVGPSSGTVQKLELQGTGATETGYFVNHTASYSYSGIYNASDSNTYNFWKSGNNYLFGTVTDPDTSGWDEHMRIDSNGRVKLHEDLVQDEVKATTTATTQTAIDTFPHASYDGAKVVITAATSADTYVTELLIATNGTTAVATEYGQIGTGSALATYDVDISGADVRILATPASTTSTTFRVAMTLT